MDERVVKFRVGVVVLSTLFLAGILVLLFGNARSFVRGSYTVYIHFDDAPGVTDGTPVRKSGILIGRVTGVRFAEQGGVIVTARIDSSVNLYHDEVPQVSGSLLGGDVVIQFVRTVKPAPKQPATPVAPPPQPAEAVIPEAGREVVVANKPPDAAPAPPENPRDKVRDGEYIEGVEAPNAFQVIGNLEDDVGAAVKSLSNAGDEVAKLANYFNRLLEGNDEQIQRIVGKTEQTLDALQRVLNNADDVLGDEKVRDNLKKSISEVPQLLADSRSTMNALRSTVESVDRNMQNLEGLTGPLGQRGDEIVDRVQRAVTRMDGLLAELTVFSRKLNSGEGSLGKLMNDPALYQHINAAAINIERISNELKPILADARVFSDKIARHPEVLGISGAIRKSPGTK